MSDIDAWRRNEAEARQEMGVLVCSCCGNKVDECDTFTCDGCGEVFCHYCILDKETPLCGPCLEKQEAFDEVEEIDIGHPLFDPDYDGKHALFRKIKAASDKRMRAMFAKLDEERGK